MNYVSWTLLIHFQKAHSKNGKDKIIENLHIVQPFEIKHIKYAIISFFA